MNVHDPAVPARACSGIRNDNTPGALVKIATLPIADPQWRDFVFSHPDAGPFHLPEWASVVADTYRFDPFVLALRDTDGELLGGLPVVSVPTPRGGRRWVALPFTDYCQMLVRCDADAATIAEAVCTHALQGPIRELELRCGFPELDRAYTFPAGYHSVIKLSEDPRDLHPNKVHRNLRNRAIRQGIRVSFGTSASDVASYYRLHTLTRRRLGVPVQPRRFFQLIADRLIAHGNGFVATAHLEDEVLAAGLYLSHGTTLVAKFAASDPAHRNNGGGYLVDWEVMSRACGEGYTVLDLGRSDLDADGLRVYKKGWGAAETPLTYTRISQHAPSDKRPSVGDLPKRIIRNSPTWVCRLLGETLYRWTA